MTASRAVTITAALLTAAGAIAAPAASAPSPGHRHSAAVTVCTGHLHAQTIRGDVSVPRDANCWISYSTVRGSVSVEPSARLVVDNSVVRGDVARSDVPRGVGDSVSLIAMVASKIAGSVSTDDGLLVDHTTVTGDVTKQTGTDFGFIGDSRIRGDVSLNVYYPAPVVRSTVGSLTIQGAGYSGVSIYKSTINGPTTASIMTLAACGNRMRGPVNIGAAAVVFGDTSPECGGNRLGSTLDLNVSFNGKFLTAQVAGNTVKGHATGTVAGPHRTFTGAGNTFLGGAGGDLDAIVDAGQGVTVSEPTSELTILRTKAQAVRDLVA